MVVIACGVWSDVVCFRLFRGMMIFILVIFLFLVCIGVEVGIVGGGVFLGEGRVLVFVLMMF